MLREDPKAKHLLYVGDRHRAPSSPRPGRDAGRRSPGACPHVPVHDLAVQPREGDVVLGTHGRSVFVAEAAPLRKLTDEVRKKDLARLPGEDAPRGTAGGATASTRGSRGPASRPSSRIAWWASSAAAGPAKLVVKDAYGNVWKESGRDVRRRA